jgi:hypothetical protein
MSQIENLPTIDIIKVGAHINSNFKTLELTVEQAKENVQAIEEELVKESRRADIRLLTANQLFDLVSACFWVHRHNKKTEEPNELMYLLEPHILKNFQGYTPQKLGKIASYYFACKQGSIDFLRQMIAVSALLSD